MSEAILDAPPVTISAFDAFLEAQADHRPWELVDGQIVGMTNPTERHEQIVANIGVPLQQAIGNRPCRVYFGGLRVQRSDNSRGINKPRPDIVVRCGSVSTQNYVTDPLIVVEVLSPSTIDVDCRCPQS
jgi:Uma2 family endonuclease